ncbi:hypothetical protein GGD50_004780 [Rhizobium paranaense]|uniref:Transposase n=1 Tax=Rhizobium paranaense TaxID=1650438 RepID=A0A7W8XV49_9HYPH|nr:hypothetical protein [Rhizobium paranaense]
MLVVSNVAIPLTSAKHRYHRDKARRSSAWGYVEIEIGVLKSQCLDRRIDDKHRMIAEINAWQQQRNAQRAQIQWMFTTEKAREKLHKAYPVKES